MPRGAVSDGDSLFDSALVLGIDEAGRGPMLGPLVMAAVALEPHKAAALTRKGVLDSKAFGAGHKGHAARSQMVPAILEAAAHAEVVVLEVAEVDRYTRQGGLNRLEQACATGLIQRAPAVGRIVADGARLFAPIAHLHPRFDAVDGGESVHVSVAAASNLAKVRRDECMQRIADRYRADFGELRGGGYVNEGTRSFLRAYLQRHGKPPPEARRSWPWDFARDLLGADWDPYADLPPEAEAPAISRTEDAVPHDPPVPRRQLALF